MQLNTIRLVCSFGIGVLIGPFAASPAAAFWGGEVAPACDAACDSTCQPPCDGGGHSHGALGEIYHHLETGAQANAMWPYPYVCPDRIWAHAPFDVMVANGWRRQNLLGDHHFDAETGKLTRAGELKVQWILTQTPPSRRQIFVERSIRADETESRLATAQEFANSIESEGGEALVLDTPIRSPRRPASMVDSERNSFIESRLPAVLPAGSSSTAATSN